MVSKEGILGSSLALGIAEAVDPSAMQPISWIWPVQKYKSFGIPRSLFLIIVNVWISLQTEIYFRRIDLQNHPWSRPAYPRDNDRELLTLDHKTQLSQSI